MGDSSEEQKLKARGLVKLSIMLALKLKIAVCYKFSLLHQLYEQTRASQSRGREASSTHSP